MKAANRPGLFRLRCEINLILGNTVAEQDSGRVKRQKGGFDENCDVDPTDFGDIHSFLVDGRGARMRASPIDAGKGRQ